MKEIYKHAIIIIIGIIMVIAALVIISPIALTRLDWEAWIALKEAGII